ncbi:hypothetical protein PPL_05494 [Heterostelium album PN500]|uniref:Alpha-galactosidase n=1 Tax=Heterostelium pallidum (strain ATCC 26659 / Pp 5 / PN500) TaxID=670386 RepID=D3BAB8_HETP5|nr:hypothetical protein PPL_05494 [Heterostelium album PN500]EFA81505.1 hypothetical protein PPL_05494 [Heterostelium album PN500]|eukprot:XP_020433622.1 hypothetical protein PPL_05494 [Heterostelium album PN500]
MTSTVSPSNLINSVHHQLINHHIQQQQHQHQPLTPQQQQQQQLNQQQQQLNQQQQQLNQQQQINQQLSQHNIFNNNNNNSIKPINLIYPNGNGLQNTTTTTANHIFTQQPLGISLAPTTTTTTTTRPIYISPTLQTAGGQHIQINTLPQQNTTLQPQQLFQDLSNTTTTTDDITSAYLLNNQLLKSQQFTANSIINTSLLPLTQAQTVVLIGDVDITIEQQPPSDVRTRTPNDRRTFNCVIRVVGDYVKNNITTVLAQLAYANSHTERPSQDILGGNKVVPVGKDGKVVFDSLSMTEASTKHQENEFCLEYILLTDDNKRFILPNGTPFLKRSRPFYAYSNQKVLSRRRNVTLRTLSSNKGSTIGGDQMHVVGSPFIRCNSLRYMKLLYNLISICCIFSVVVQSLQNGLGLTPQMGWNSWNHFGCDINEDIIMQTAKAMATNGMKEAGYIYVNIDDCWASHRNESGHIQADSKTFPNGIAYLADYVHSLGMKLGIYTDAGPLTCQRRPGSYDHEEIDAQTYAAWGVDYVKEDWCWAFLSNPLDRYAIMSQALNGTGRPIFFSLCDWGTDNPWEWGPTVGNSFRTTSDIKDTWDSFLDNLDKQIPITSYSQVGGWNDPDMLEVGNGGMSYTEYLSHFQLWSIINAPLIAGNDMRTVDQQYLDIFTAPEIVAVNQDPLGKQGSLVRSYNSGLQQVWAKPMADGSRAAVLFNRDSSSAGIQLFWADIFLTPNTSMTVRDLWSQKDLGSFTDYYVALNIPSHGSVMLKVY